MSSTVLSLYRTGILRSSLHIQNNRTKDIYTRTLCSAHKTILNRPFDRHNTAAASCQLPLISNSYHHIPSNLVRENPTKHQSPLVDSYVLCDHSLDTSSSDTKTLDSLTPCGKCNLLGNYDIWPPGGTHASYTTSLPLSRYRSLLSTSQVDANWLVLRSFHTSHGYRKDESKAEQTVNALKDEVRQKTETTTKTATDVSSVSKAEPPITSEETPKSAAPPVTVKKSLKERIVAEVKHYYHGFRLLFIDVRVCIRLLWQVLNAKSLSRRERRQLVRTTADLFRLVPFLVFIVVPFMEFLLPVAIKLFPGMLPSTFTEANKEQEKLRKKLKVKLEMAKFLQDTIEETALQRKGAKGESVQEFANFMERIRTSGQPTSNEEIIKYSKLFDEDITLDNLDYNQLRALLKLLDLPAVGTSNFLRFRLRMKLRQLETDDRMITKEGVDSMAVWELQEACRARGMRGLGVAKERLRIQLQQWLDLHLNAKIPTSLLLLSRTLYLSEHLSTEEQLKATISTLPETTAAEAKVKISEVTGDRLDHKTKLEIIQQEEQAIKKEKEEEEKRAAEEAKKMDEEAKKAEAEVLVDQAETIKDPADAVKSVAEPIIPSIADSVPEKAPLAEEILQDRAEILDTADKEVKAEISKEELESIEDVLENVAEEKSPVTLEHEGLQTLKEDVSEYKEALEDLKEVVLSSNGHQQELIESKSAKRLSRKVTSMVEQMADLMADLNKEKSQIMEDIEIKEVKMKRSDTLRNDEQLLQDMREQISVDKHAVVTINELVLAMRRIQKVPDDTKLQRIAQVLDEDRDGVIDVNDALKVIELLGEENVSVEPEHMSEIMNLLRREEQVEQLDKEEKIREKLSKQNSAEQTTSSPEQAETPGEFTGQAETPSDSVEKLNDQQEERKQ